MKLLIAIGIVIVAAIHGYGAAWLAIWMLFHPYKSVKFLGVTIWPQGMIPRHREKLAQSIGNAVGNELVSQQTVFDALFETSFFQNKVENFVGSYTEDLLGRVYPSFIDALPSQARAPVLDTISALQYRLAEYITEMLKSDETAEAIERFVDKQVDDLAQRRIGEVVSSQSVDRARDFVEQRLQRMMGTEGFEQTVREFVSGRLDDLAHSNATLAETFTPETIAFIKERIDQQVPPIVHHLADIATSQTTRKQIGAVKFDELKNQITNRLVEILRSEILFTSISVHFTEAIDRFFPQTIGAV